jgi:hypothetical protein
MMPTDHHVFLDIAANRKVIIVLNAGEDSGEALGDIVDITSKLLDKLDSSYLEALYLLGDSTLYERAFFSQQFHRWRHRNLHRLGLLRPILEAQDSENIDFVIIVTHRIPYDLDDYDCVPWRGKIVLLPVAENLVNDEWGYAKGDFNLVTRWEDIVSQVKDNVYKIEIGAPDAIPYSWDNPGFHWENGLLVAERLEDYKCAASFLAPPDASLSARITYQSGATKDFLLRLASPLSPEHHALSQRETNILEACLSSSAYSCPFCGERHTKDIIYCQSGDRSGPGSLFGSMVYTDLKFRAGRQPLYYLLFVKQESQLTACLVRNPVLRVASNMVAYREGAGRARVYVYDRQLLAWQPQERYLEQYEELSPKTYVVVL